MFWTSFEHAIEVMDPSPECNATEGSSDLPETAVEVTLSIEKGSVKESGDPLDEPTADTLHMEHEEVYLTADDSGEVHPRGNFRLLFAS